MCIFLVWRKFGLLPLSQLVESLYLQMVDAQKVLVVNASQVLVEHCAGDSLAQMATISSYLFAGAALCLDVSSFQNMVEKLVL